MYEMHRRRQFKVASTLRCRTLGQNKRGDHVLIHELISGALIKREVKSKIHVWVGGILINRGLGFK